MNLVSEDFSNYPSHLKQIQQIGDGFITLSADNALRFYDSESQFKGVHELKSQTYEFVTLDSGYIISTMNQPPSFWKLKEDGPKYNTGYKTQNHLEETISPISLHVNENCLFCGFKKQAQIFDLEDPSKPILKVKTPSVVSAIDYSESYSVAALGKYDSAVLLYDM